MNNYIYAFLLTLFAGLATGIGSLIVFFTKKSNTKFLAISLGFSAGVMIYVSMVEILNESQQILVGALGDKLGSWISVVSFFLGMLVIAVIDRLIPEGENPHELHSIEEMSEEHMDEHHMDQIIMRQEAQKNHKLLRMGILTALAIGIHNFPEGIATFVSSLQDPKLGIMIAFAIAIHNIPEGIAVSVPIYYSTGSRKKAFKYSFLSGLSEPVGAIIGFLILTPIMSDTLMGVIFSMVAGIMVFISFDELLPSAREYGEHHLSIYGLVVGMMVMAVSLLLFK
ncbi:zinc transporter ZupT [Peptostreptococcus equinus]|uniref:Zinc transporter ZupT n=1 Tax=Peptostreptococcus equinus TaxID=3003601 RepID=A0ABY7JSF9_9FIRM|nr:zinc transporter ZupT [Peptostreptococcus sp. CBA3647]WAW15404.1 zinc transporter ZupT [Peptostreptococcus sp. CBA3647]